MGKVVTSKGLNEFVESGKVTHVPDHKPEAKAPVPEVKESPKDANPAEVKAVETRAEVKPDVEGLEPDEIDLPERVRKSIGKKHRAMKEAQEAAAEADRLAESQYNRAMLAERRANELEEKLKQAKPPEPEKAPELKAPDETDPQWMENGQFNWRKFTAAQSEYSAKKAVADYDREQGEKRAAAERTEHEARIAASAEAARKKYPDFDAKMEAAKATAADIVPQFVLNYIYESEEQSADIAYYLVDHPDEAQRISKMKPILGLAELGKLADKLTAKPDIKPNGEIAPAVVPERGGAPPPITPIATTASGTVNTDPARMTFRELREFEKSRSKKR